MPRFYFHIYDGDAFLDDEGTVLPGLQQAKEQAVRAIATVLKDRIGTPEADEAWRMDIVDSLGKVLLRLSLDATEGRDAPTYLLDVKPGPGKVN